jgi:hypothetical protein
MSFKHNTSLTSDGILQQSDYESPSGHLLDAQAQGDLIVADSTTTMARLAAGAADTVLTSNGTTPAYDKLTTANINDATLVTAADTVASNDNDTTIPTTAAVKDYVDAQVSGTTLTFADDVAATGSVDLNTQTFTVAGTANEIETSAASQTVTIGLPNSVTINTLTVTNPLGPASGGTGQDLSGSTGALSISSGTVSAGTLGIANGGTGSTGGVTQYQLAVGGASNVVATLADGVGTAGEVLTSNGAGAEPTWGDAVTYATVNELETGTATDRVISPDVLAGSNFGEIAYVVQCFKPTADVATGDGAQHFIIPSNMDGMNLVDAYASLVTAGTGSGTIDIQIHNVTDAQDVLSTKITIDAAAKSANDGVIDTLYDDVDSWDEWRIDVDAVTATTPGQGLIVTLIFRLP